MTYDKIWEWIYENFDTNSYFSAEDLLYDVKNEFVRTGSVFPIQAEDLVKERFQYRREYAEMEARAREQQQISQLVGNSQLLKSTSDEVIEQLRRPEIMGVDISEYATQRETVVPPEIQKFYQTKETFFGRIANTFRRLLRR